jgi:hypothetical protein
LIDRISWRTGRMVMQKNSTGLMAGAIALAASLIYASTAARADDQLKVAIGQINNWENQIRRSARTPASSRSTD